MSGRNRGPPFPMKGVVPQGGMPPIHDPPFGRGVGQLPHHALREELLREEMRESQFSRGQMPPHQALREEMREPQFGRGQIPPHHALREELRESQFGRGQIPPHHALREEMREHRFGMDHRQLPPHPAIIEEQLAAQHQDIQGLLVDNQRLAFTHVALKQELESAQLELQQTSHFANSLHMEKDMQMRELYDKSNKLEMDLAEAEGMKAELQHVQSDVKELTAVKQDLTAQVQAMTQDLARVTADLQQIPALKAEIDGLKQELHRARAAIEYEKKGYAENYEHGQVLEQKLISMGRELEKLRAEMANAEKRGRAAAAAAVAAVPGYTGNYPDTGYAGNHYPPNYGVNPINPGQVGAEGYPQYGPGPGSWGAYDMQRAQGHR